MAITSPGEYVVMYNDDDVDYHYRFQFADFTIPAKGKKIVPWGHFTYLCGNPFFDNSDRNQVRENEYQRIRTRFGRDRKPEMWPKLRAEDPDGDPIISVMEDRYGEHAPRGDASDPMDPAALRAQLDQMARRQAALEELLKVQERATAGPTPADVPEDPAPPVRRGPKLDIDDIVEAEITDLSSDGEDVIPADIPEDTPTKTPVRTTRRRSSST